jgi:SWI/SNF-related matrix-associated actin-dependent regulator of chromatin subfamily A member 5
MRRAWCDVCRGGSEGKGDELIKCTGCSRKFHRDCVKMPAKGPLVCEACRSGESAQGQAQSKTMKAALGRVRAAHTQLRARSCAFYKQEKKRLAPFVPPARLKKIMEPAGASSRAAPNVPRIGASESYIRAELRSYQVDGVNWILSRYENGVGGILGDEMGLGKTLQTLSFIAALKEAGFPGPHLVITPLAVLQNWENEIKKFVPTITAIKVHGSAQERDRIFSLPAVLGAEYDVYLTTYEMIICEEAFFTENFLFHTLVIDEGHRIKNENSKLAESLARIPTPFRLLLTGTPLQNNMNELWSLLYYVLPMALEDCREKFEQACSLSDGQLNQRVAAQARALLETMMLR